MPHRTEPRRNRYYSSKNASEHQLKKHKVLFLVTLFVLIQVFGSCTQVQAIPTVTPKPRPSPSPTIESASPAVNVLPAIPSLAIEDRYRADIVLLGNEEYKLAVFATPEDLAKITQVNAKMPSGNIAALQIEDGSWHYSANGIPSKGTYTFNVVLIKGEEFKKTFYYSADGS